MPAKTLHNLIVDAPPNPCRTGTPLLDSRTREPVICGGPEKCAVGYFCAVGASPETTNCCREGEQASERLRSSGGRLLTCLHARLFVCLLAEGNPCQIDVEVGVGTHRLDRWAYDRRTSMCRQFEASSFGLITLVNSTSIILSTKGNAATTTIFCRATSANANVKVWERMFCRLQPSNNWQSNS